MILVQREKVLLRYVGVLPGTESVLYYMYYISLVDIGIWLCGELNFKY